MAADSQAYEDVPSGRSGGKIMKARRTGVWITPYDRPTSPPPESALLQSESPSWLCGLVSPAKLVADGASKVFSSFWNPKSWAMASFSSSNSDSDSDSETDDDSGDNENTYEGISKLNQHLKDSSYKKREILHSIEELLMLDRYSREECDKLIEIVNSRVVDYSIRDGVGTGPSITHTKTNNGKTTNIFIYLY